MSRFAFAVSAWMALAVAGPASAFCPGTLGIGLPFLFGSDTTPEPNRTSDAPGLLLVQDCPRAGCPAEISENERIAETAVKHIFPGGLLGSGIVQTSATIPVPPTEKATRRVTVQAGPWTCSCDRVVAGEREMLLEGNVTMTMRGRDTAIHAGRARVNLNDGSVIAD